MSNVIDVPDHIDKQNQEESDQDNRDNDLKFINESDVAESLPIYYSISDTHAHHPVETSRSSCLY